MSNRSRFPLDTISAGVILMIIATTYLFYASAIDINEVFSYFRRIPFHHGIEIPPRSLIDAIVFFFNAVGVWTFVLAGLRVVIQNNMSGAVGDVIGAFFAFFTAYLVTSYANRTFSWQTTIAYFIVGIGVLIILNAILYYYYPKRREHEI